MKNSKTTTTSHRSRSANRIRKTSVVAAQGIAALAGCLPVLAVAADDAQAGDELEAVMVTASRIQAPGFQAPTPTTVVDSNSLRELGITNLGQLTYQLPGFVGTENPANSSVRSGGGASSFNLRGLGSNRTLFLLNSRRFVHDSPRGRSDTNVVPSSAIERVEVVTGGASAAWGSDAVAGVVNVILKNELVGTDAEVQLGRSSYGDNEDVKFSLAHGQAFAGGRGHFMIAGEYQNNDGVTRQGDRDWGKKEWWVINNPTYTPTNGQYANLLVQQGRANNATYGGLIVSGVLAGTQFLSGGVPATFNPGLYAVGRQGSVGGDGPNLSLDLNVLVPLERSAFFTHSSFDITDDLKVFLEGTYGNSRAHYGLVNNQNLGDLTIQADNAFLPASLRTRLNAAGETSFKMGRIDRDFGRIQENNLNRTRTGVLGLEGSLPAEWKWDAYYQYGHTHETLHEGPTVINARFARAVDAVVGPNGQIVCRSTLTSPTDGCLPLNLFGEGSPSPQAIAYATGMRDENTVFTQNNAAFNVRGTLFSIAGQPVPLAAGLEYNKEKLDHTVDPVSQASGFQIGNPKFFTGDISVKEAYAEVALPLLTDKSFAKSLRVDLADRYVDYSTTGTANTWKAGLVWDIVPDVRVRVTRSRDIRAPNANELFSFGGLSFVTLFDSVRGVAVPGLVRQVNSPNPNLEPEKADTWTYGLVFEPRWVPGLRVSLDRYDIDISGAIGSVGAQARVDRCAGGNQQFCDTLVRDSSGTIVEIQAGIINFQNLTARGYDFEAMYNKALPVGVLTVRALANYAQDLITNDGIRSLDQAGAVSWASTATVPHWRGTTTVAYRIGNLSVNANGRYVGGGQYYDGTAPLARYDQHFSGRTYFDFGFGYDLPLPGNGTSQLYARVNNAFDRDPPIITEPFPGAPMTNYTLYDTIGRTFQVGFRLSY